MAADDVHAPTNAGPADKSPTFEAPPSAAAPRPEPSASGTGPLDRPEVQVGAAFAGGFLAAMILRRLGS